jgi:nicotinate-nucleotide adenylyltransferase
MSAGQLPQRCGVMGGTFDPIHHGHLVAASEVAHFFSLDEVIFVPTGRPWQKAGREVSAPEDRYLMTVIATASNPRFSVSRVDIDRPGPTYTIDTLRELHTLRGPDAEFFFITGADALEQIMTWQDADELFKLAHFVGCTRPGHRLTGADLPDDRVSLIEIPALAISSTTCRQRVAAGAPIWYLVPDGIVQYISKRKLYRALDAGQPDGLSGIRRYPEQGVTGADRLAEGASGDGASPS